MFSTVRADGVSSPNLACLLVSKQPMALLTKLTAPVTLYCYFLNDNREFIARFHCAVHQNANLQRLSIVCCNATFTLSI